MSAAEGVTVSPISPNGEMRQLWDMEAAVIEYAMRHVWTTSAAQELFGSEDLGRVHPCVRPVHAAPHGCGP